jgi:hypothetical protein
MFLTIALIVNGLKFSIPGMDTVTLSSADHQKEKNAD